MNSPYIGDRPLDPPEDDECEFCNGTGVLHSGCDCQECRYDPDPGEPNEEPDI